MPLFERFIISFVGLFVSVTAAANYEGIFGLGPSDLRTSKPALVVGVAAEDWQFTLSAIFNSEYNEKDFSNQPLPGSGIEDLGEKQIGNVMGLDVGKQFAVTEAWLKAFVEGGFYFGRRSRILKSTLTGWVWSYDDKSTSFLGAGAGLIAKFDPNSKASWGLGLHTIRGVSLLFLYEF